MGRTIPIIVDIPTPKPALGFSEYGEAIADAIRGGYPAQFTVGIYGPWGSGKTSLLNAIRAELEKHGDDVTCVFFDAWRYEKTGAIIVPLLHAVYHQVESVRNDRLRNQLRKTISALLFSLNFKSPFIELDLDRLRTKVASDASLTQLDLAFSKPYEEMQAVTEALRSRRIVVLIDDLDRCSHGSVVELLEAINLVMHVPGMVFVLALDYEVLVEAVNHKYPHANGHKFIEKMVQVPFRAPPTPSTGYILAGTNPWLERANGIVTPGLRGSCLRRCHNCARW